MQTFLGSLHFAQVAGIFHINLVYNSKAASPYPFFTLGQTEVDRSAKFRLKSTKIPTTLIYTHINSTRSSFMQDRQNRIVHIYLKPFKNTQKYIIF